MSIINIKQVAEWQGYAPLMHIAGHKSCGSKIKGEIRDDDIKRN